MKHMLHIAMVVFVAVWLTACDAGKSTREISVQSVASYDGTPIAYDVAGSGDISIVFVHCWTCNKNFWDGQFSAFAEKYKVVRLDLAGHGQSGKSNREYVIQDFARDVVAVVNHLDLKKIILVGHSMGGPVAVEAEKILGKRVIGVVGVDTFYTAFPLPKNDAEAEAFVQPFREDFSGTTGKMIESMFLPTAEPNAKNKIISAVLSADQAMAIKALTGIVQWYRFEAESALAQLGKRLKNINADPEGNTQPANDTVINIAGVGHFVPQMKATEFNQALDELILYFEGL